MKKLFNIPSNQSLILLIVMISSITTTVKAQNPFIRNQFTADPTARVFGDRLYVYPSHDILAQPGKGRVGWFCMEDYHVFSSANLTDWTDHGMIVSQTKVPWANPAGYSMWAPDCIERNGKYYFYFPTLPKDTLLYGRSFGIGVAVADKPTGPFVPETEPIKGVKGIDPNVFIDKDGQAYLYWSQGNIYVAKLKENMRELASEVVTIPNLPTKGLKEGPFVFERNGLYYLTFPHVENKTERLEYAIGDNPMGPFKMTGVIMDESATGCWTNHHSIIQYKKQWYLFYHHNDYSPKFDKARSVRLDSLSFNADGTIQKVIPTLRGAGITNAKTEIQIDRYSKIGEQAAISFIDTADTFKGWKTKFTEAGAWVQYNTVDFGSRPVKKLMFKMLAEQDGTLEIRTGSLTGPLLCKVDIKKTNEWMVVGSGDIKKITGIQNLFVVLKEGKGIEIDWLRFE
ncbi:family 43 glycosylhydrolase [Sediminibacterium goheungense]|uniref:Carbohydrate binding protein with CBM6 domain n=1 Tax=Sediminibacterium goheungense TaxID=1086393 RepID=A0A4V3C4K1_9BACT|nr:family 43 glycosylhydrolase [Sediminibacterium goheungense]TDO26268.1 carbohydrate binding protein with CBM6 domain [Sediminibacterium goheungense]